MIAKKSLTLFAIALVLTVGYGYGQNRFVSTTGDDTGNDCDNQNNPCLTIEHAYSKSVDNESILISPGSYNLSSTLELEKEGITLTAADNTQKPEITSSASDVISVKVKDVTISNLIFKMGLTSSNGMRGIVGTSGFDGVKVINNEFYSTKSTSWISSGMVFGAYAIHFQDSVNGESNVTIKNNLISRDGNDKDIFGRGIGLGKGGSTAGRGPGGLVVENTIDAYYPIQGIEIHHDLEILGNHLAGMTNFGYSFDNSSIILDNNVFDLVNDQHADKVYAVLEVKAIKNGSISIVNNVIKNYLRIGFLSMASQNISVENNIFKPSATADAFTSIHVNTKLMTTSNQSTSYIDDIVIKGNTFNAGVTGFGTAISFADHYGVNSPAYGDVTIGGSTAEEKNIFDVAMKNYITLDSLTGSSDEFPLWNPPFGSGGNYTPETIMQPVSQDFTALSSENNYGLYTNQEIEDKNIDKEDNSELGRIIIGPISGVGLEKNALSNSSIYPNPTADNFTITFDNDEEATMKLIDQTGRTVIYRKVKDGESINIEALKSGVYFVKLTTEKQTFSSKLIKK